MLSSGKGVGLPFFETVPAGLENPTLTSGIEVVPRAVYVVVSPNVSRKAEK